MSAVFGILGVIAPPACGGSTSKATADGGGGGNGGGGGDASAGVDGVAAVSDAAGETGSACFAHVATFTSVTYAPVTARQGVCTDADIAAFVAACGDSGTQTACTAWETQNLSADGGGTACGVCIAGPGSEWAVDGTGKRVPIGPNYPGCVQLLDPANGGTCAPAQLQWDSCDFLECGTCTGTWGDGTPEDPAACDSMADASTCATVASAADSACATEWADGGVESQCSPGLGSGYDPDYDFILGLICGSGPVDAGSGG